MSHGLFRDLHMLHSNMSALDPASWNPSTRALAGFGAVAAGTAISVATGGLASAAGLAIAGLFTNFLAGDIAKLWDDRSRDPKFAHPNHDLTKLVGEGIAHVLHAAADDENLETHSTWFRNLAESSSQFYENLSILPDFQAIASDQLPTLFHQATKSDNGSYPLLTEAIWLDFAESLAHKVKIPASRQAALIAATRLHQRLFAAIREMFKRDFSGQGRAYAALCLDMNSLILGKVDQVLQSQEAMRADLHALTVGLRQNHNRYCSALTPEQSAGLAWMIAEFRVVSDRTENILAIVTETRHDTKSILAHQPNIATKDDLKALAETLHNPIPPTTQAIPFLCDISRIDRYAPAELIGREKELAFLNDAWNKASAVERKRPHILTFVAMGGEGKTSLVAKWLANLAYEDWPNCEAAFAWSFYNQGTSDQSTASSDAFLAAALTFFGDEQTANSPKHATEKAKRVAELVSQRRTILVLDGVEPLQYPPGPPHDGRLKDDGLAALLKKLAAFKHHSLCVVTTRYTLPDLKNFRQTTAPETDLRRLSTEAGGTLLKHLGVRGTEQEFQQLVDDVKGHALTLNLLGAYLRDAHAGDIRKRDLVKLEEADAEEQSGHAFRVMDSYVNWLKTKSENRALTAILRLLGLFDRPATADCLAALWRAPAIAGLTEPLINLSDAQRNLALKRLEAMKLLTINRTSADQLVSVDAHPLLRDYFAMQLRDHQPNAWSAAHRRLYEHLCQLTSDQKKEPTVVDLQSLYQAVAHGSQAGLQLETFRDVYLLRILRGTRTTGFYDTRRLGAFGSNLGAVTCFFDSPWNRVSSALPEAARSLALSQAAGCLHALGRLTDSLEPMLAVAHMSEHVGDWSNAARDFSNLSELQLALGDLNAAVQYASMSVSFADASSDAFVKTVNRAMHAGVLLENGRSDDARLLFKQAEQMQKNDQPRYPLLYSVQGIRYCELLLVDAERCVWQLQLNPQSRVDSWLAESCAEVSERAALTLTWEEHMHCAPILDFALHYLTLARAALYKTILECVDMCDLALDASNINRAIASLQLAGRQDYLPRTHLTRALLRRLASDPTGSQSDLDEAWDIAERGPMRLHMADIHLYRARLFFREPQYPWADWDRWQTDKSDPPHTRTAADDLIAAEKLINECGYHRRDQELADAKSAIR